MREKFAGKNSWRWLQECRLQHEHTNHVQKKSYVLLMRENTLAEEKPSQHCVEGNQSCAEESCTHPPIRLLNPKSHCITKVSGRCTSPHDTSGVWRNYLCQITQRYQKETKASSITERQKILLSVLLSNLLCTMLLVTKPELGFRVSASSAKITDFPSEHQVCFKLRKRHVQSVSKVPWQGWDGAGERYVLQRNIWCCWSLPAAAYHLALLSCVFCNNQILPWIF